MNTPSLKGKPIMHILVRITIVLGAVLYISLTAVPARADADGDTRPASRIQRMFANLPMAFEPNQGHVAATIDFLARSAEYVTYLTATEAVVAISPSVGQPLSRATTLRLRLLGVNADAKGTGLAALRGTRNYLSGTDATRWRSGIPTYAQVRYADIYGGIDVVYYGVHGHLEYDFIVQPGADPAVIRLDLVGVKQLAVDEAGDLVVTTDAQRLRMRRPISYQEVDGERVSVSSRYIVHGHQVAFEVGAYDTSRPLIIDPVVIVYSSYLGGSGHDVGNAIAVDHDGNVYVAGETRSLDFPIADAFQSQHGGPDGARIDGFVTKIAADGSAILYSTYLGGRDSDFVSAIAVDAAGNAYVTGETASDDFPTVAAIQPAYRGNNDAFVAKLGPDGTVVFSTYLGGSSLDRASAIAVDIAGRPYVTGATGSSDFPTVNPLQAARAGQGNFDAFVTKFDPTGTLVYSTYLGGSDIEEGRGIAVDTVGQAHVTGRSRSNDFPAPAGVPTPIRRGIDDVFVVKLDASGQALVYSRFVGGSGGDHATGIGLDAAGNAYVGGFTDSVDFPVTAGAFGQTIGTGGTFRTDGFVIKLRPDGTVGYATYLGGNDFDVIAAIAVDSAGNAYLTGGTLSPDFPTVGAFDDSLRVSGGGNLGDAIVAKLNPTGSALLYSSYLGGKDADAAFSIAVDGSGNAYITGSTGSKSFPRVHAFQPRHRHDPDLGTSDAFVVKIAEVP